MEKNSFFYIKCRGKNDELLTIKHFKDGRSACPVCGSISIHPCEPAWSETINRDEKGVHICGPSYDICPCCDTQFGLDDSDMMLDGKHLTIIEAWAHLRKEWLHSMKRLNRLREAIDQLKNIDLSDDDIKSILKQDNK